MDVEVFYDGSTAMIRFPDGGVMRLADAQRQISPDLEFDDISGLPLASTPTPYDPSQSANTSEPNRFGDVGSRYGNESLQAAGDMLSNKVNLYDALPSSMQGGVMEPVNRTIMNAATLGAGGLMGLLGLFEKGVGYGSEIVAGGSESEKRLARDLLGGSEVAGIGPEARAMAALSGSASQQASRSAIDRLNQPGPVPTMYSNPLGGAKPKSTSPAQEVAGLLSSGRADEVTDEMLAKFTPKDEMEIFDLYQRGATGMDLPMDEAARMARAGEIGSDTGVPLYRGDQQSMRQSFDTGTGTRANIGVTSSTSPNVAATYMTGDNPAMFPLFARSENELSLDAQGRTWRGIPADAMANTSRLDDILDVQKYLDDDNLFDYNAPAVDWGDGSSTNMAMTDTNSVSRAAQEAGFDQVRFRNIVDRGGAGRFHTGPANDPHTTVMTADPSNIRSRFARFDPRLSHLRNLSAGVGGMGLLGMSYPQKEQY